MAFKTREQIDLCVCPSLRLSLSLSMYSFQFSSAEYFRATRMRKAILTTADASGATV